MRVNARAAEDARAPLRQYTIIFAFLSGTIPSTEFIRSSRIFSAQSFKNGRRYDKQLGFLFGKEIDFKAEIFQHAGGAHNTDVQRQQAIKADFPAVIRINKRPKLPAFNQKKAGAFP